MLGGCFPKKWSDDESSRSGHDMALMKINSKKWMSGLPSPLPDDRPITAINVVEDIDKCPADFSVVSKTYDQDIDADLWRESGLFIKKKGRYICISKTNGLLNHVVQDIVVINERDSPPDGFTMINQTLDTEQRAWRKKKICYKLSNRGTCSQAVTDIIVCSRIKKAPAGFTYAGELNGVIVCYKTSQVTNGDTSSQPYENIDPTRSLLQNASPNPSNGVPHRAPPERPPKPKFSPKPQNGVYPKVPNKTDASDDSSDRDYEILSPNARIKPTRPAPQPPTTSVVTGSVPIYGTLPGTSDLDGVPFVLNSMLSFHTETWVSVLPVIKARTQKEIDKEYHYDFRAERET